MTGPIYTWKTQGNMAYSYEVVPKGIFRDKEATKEKVVSDSEPNIESLSLSLSLGNYSFCKVKPTPPLVYTTRIEHIMKRMT